MKAFKLRPDKRRGIFIVLTLIILAVFAIMGVVIYSTGSTEYNHTMLVAYKLKADNLAQAVVEEALCVVYDKVCRPVDQDVSDDEAGGRIPPPWKALLFEKVLEVAGDSDAATDIGVILSFDLVELGLIPETIALLAGQDCVIEECVIDFEGFRKIWSSSNGIFVKNRGVVYYKDPSTNLDAEDYEYPYPNDFQGYAVIKVKVSYGKGRIKMSRHLSSIHDIKLVNQTPMARRFALFQWYPNPDPTSQMEDLNSGGGFKLFPNDAARLFVRGPYVVDTYGNERGIGGENAPGGGPSYWSNNWHGWSNVPTSRAGIMQSSVDAKSPSRPDSTSGSGPDVSLLGMNAQGDPGFSIGGSQEWLCASQPDTPANRYNSFSLMGDTEERNADGTPQTFEGIVSKATSDGQEDLVGAPGGEWPDSSGMENIEDVYFKRIEGGGLYHRCHLAKFKQRKFSMPLLFVSIDMVEYSVEITDDNVTMPYGCYYMPNEKPSATAAIIGAIVGTVLGVAAMYSPAVSGIMGVTAQEFVQITMMTNAIGSLVGGFDNVSVASGSFGPAVDPGQVVGFYPPNFRDVPRLASRWYYSLDDIPSYRQDDPENFPVLLDGTMFVHTLHNQRWFKYLGKGSLVSSNSGGEESRRNPVMEGPVMSVCGPMIDHLNLIYTGKQTQAQLGEDLLYIKSPPGEPGTFIDASVFSVQGVAPADNTASVTIGGNYICGYFNKAKTLVDTELVVRYNTEYKPKTDGTEDDKISAFEDGRWHSASLSFRSSGWYEQRRE